MPFRTEDALTVNSNRNVTAPRKPVRQLRYIVILDNFIEVQFIANSYKHKFRCVRFYVSYILLVANCIFRGIGITGNFDQKIVFATSISTLQLTIYISIKHIKVLETTPIKAPTVRPHTSHYENYQSWTNQTFRTLLEKQERGHK